MVSDAPAVLNKTARRSFTISFSDYFIPIKKFLVFNGCILYLILYKWGIYKYFFVCSEMTEMSRAYSKVVAYRNCRFSVTKNESSKG